jgi:hypothetical protein
MQGVSSPEPQGAVGRTVGQVLYLIGRDGRPGVTPVQVTEEIRRTTLEGTIVVHAVRAPGEPEPFTLNEQHEAFPSGRPTPHGPSSRAAPRRRSTR